MHSEHDSQGPDFSWLMRSAAGEVIGFAGLSEDGRSDVGSQALVRELARALHELVPPGGVDPAEGRPRSTRTRPRSRS
jgi:hypothetical protein